MSKKQAIIIYPHLNDCGGDLTQKWYVEYKWRIPGDDKVRKERVYKGIYSGPEKQRRKEAARVIKEKTEWLKSGSYLQGNVKKVYADELHYRHEAAVYHEIKAHVVTTRTNLSEFLSQIKEKVNAKTYENYVSKMRIFNTWLNAKRLDELSIDKITRQHIIAFSVYLSSEQKLSRLTIKKYIQILRTFFDFEFDRESIAINPVTRIPVMGTVVDMAAVPFQTDERKRLKEVIEFTDPQLWIACEIQYYCAIRPGTELRLMKLSWIDYDRKKLRIPSTEHKGNRTDQVDIPDYLFEKLKEFQRYDQNLYLFGQFNRPNFQPVGKNTLRNRFNRYREDLEISPDRKFYSWKHTGAIQLLDNGMQPHDLQNHLRHRSFATTEVYIKKRAGNLEGKVDRFSSEI